MTAVTPDRTMEEAADADDPCGPSRMLWISEAGGLTQFGAFVHVLPPGSRTALKHWHSAEDEMAYVLEGELTLVEGAAETLLHPGDAAAFKAGDPVGHFLVNRGTAPARCLVVGTRAPVDTITYPDHDRVCLRDRSLPDDIWTEGHGRPARSPYSVSE